MYFIKYNIKENLPNAFSDIFFEDILSVYHTFFHLIQCLIMFQFFGNVHVDYKKDNNTCHIVCTNSLRNVEAVKKN